MADLIAKGLAWLHGQHRSHGSQGVTYARGQSSVTAVPATPGPSEFDVDDGAGGMLRVNRTDFFIDVADLELDGIPVEPAAGDRITMGTVVYEVMPPGPGAPAWRFTDPFRTRYRIHAKEVDATT